MHNLKYL